MTGRAVAGQAGFRAAALGLVRVNRGWAGPASPRPPKSNFRVTEYLRLRHVMALRAERPEDEMMPARMNVAAAVVTGLFSAGSALAAPFPASTAAFAFFTSPTVVLGPSSNTLDISTPAITLDGTDTYVVLFLGSGGISGSGTVDPHWGAGNGVIAFSTTPDATIGQSLSSLFSFRDNTGGFYVFDLTSVTTVTYATSSAQNQFTLSLLGLLSDSFLGYTPAAASLDVTFNNTNGSSYSLSGRLTAPPSASPIPEPAALVLFSLGLAATCFSHRLAPPRVRRTAFRGLERIALA